MTIEYSRPNNKQDFRGVPPVVVTFTNCNRSIIATRGTKQKCRQWRKATFLFTHLMAARYSLDSALYINHPRLQLGSNTANNDNVPKGIKGNSMVYKNRARTDRKIVATVKHPANPPDLALHAQPNTNMVPANYTSAPIRGYQHFPHHPCDEQMLCVPNRRRARRRR